MAERSIIIDHFTDLTENADAIEAAAQLMPKQVFTNPGVEQDFFDVYTINQDAILGIINRHGLVNLNAYVDVPLGSNYSLAMILWSITENEDGSRRDISWYNTIPVVAQRVQWSGVIPWEVNEVQLHLLSSDGRWVPDGARRLYRSTTLANGSRTWTSKPILLSSFLQRLTKLTLVNSANAIAVSTGGNLPGLSGWTMQIALASSSNGPFTFSQVWPSDAFIAQNNWRYAKLRLSYVGGLPVVGLERVELTIQEEYASESPDLPKRVTKSNIYVPKLQVFIDGQEVSAFVSRVSPGECVLLLDQDWLASKAVPGANIQVFLDGVLAQQGILGEIRKEQYLNGDSVSIRILRPIDLLGRSEDYPVIVNTDGQTPQLEFADDLGYIAVLMNRIVPGLRPYVEDRIPWRDISTWKQRPDTSRGEVKLVELETDNDWLQLYALRNQSVREKIEQVAQANGYTLTSHAGVPYLVRLAPYSNEDLTRLLSRARVLHRDAQGRFFPELRFGVPNLTFSDEAPSELRLTGLADAVPDNLPALNVYFRRIDGTFTPELAINSFHHSTQADLYVRLPGGTIALAVFRSIESVDIRHVPGVDINPFADNRPYYEWVYGTRAGYTGIVGVKFWMAGAILEYDEYYLSAKGILQYADGGQRDDAPVWKASGQHVPAWGRILDPANPQRQTHNLVNVLLTAGQRLHGNKENIENPFVPKYSLPPGRDSITIGGWTAYRDYGDRLADLIATRRALQLIQAEMPVIGYSGFKANDVIALARMPEDGIGGIVQLLDMYLVLDEPDLQVEAGGRVRSAVRLGYIGTLPTGQSPIYTTDIAWMQRGQSDGWWL